MPKRAADEETIVCRTPTPGKAPTRIPKWKYDATRRAILAATPKSGEGIPFAELPEIVAATLPDAIRDRLGSIMWHVTTVKLHMETVGEIERTPGAKPQRLRRVAAAPKKRQASKKPR